jgi:hypothetical protein
MGVYLIGVCLMGVYLTGVDLMAEGIKVSRKDFISRLKDLTEYCSLHSLTVTKKSGDLPLNESRRMVLSGQSRANHRGVIKLGQQI